MKLKRDTKFGEELTRGFKIGRRNLTNCHPSAGKSENYLFKCAPFQQSIYCLS